MVTIALTPNDYHKSFYGKARVEYDVETHTATLISYTTPVITVNLETNAITRLWSGYSATTMRHINAFMDMLSLPYGGKTWWNTLTIGGK